MDIKMIYFSKPFITNLEIKEIQKVLKSGVLTDGFYQNLSEKIIKKRLKSKYIALTQSCSDALELSCLLIDLKPGDEVIMPSYTFTSTANCVALRGAKPVFVDIKANDMCIDIDQIEKMITKKN
jgi:Predicted pyridoxal phosphate-dependent enzyme apparently involved in regulation of cell wall biogenesis